MDSTLGRWLMIGLILLITVGMALLIPVLLQLIGPKDTPVVILPTSPPTTPHTAATAPIPPSALVPTTAPTTAPKPTPKPTLPPSPTPLPLQVGYTVHTVSGEETLEGIAVRYGSLPLSIASLNRFPPEAPLGDGQALVIPLYSGLEPSEPFQVCGLEVDRGLSGRRVALTFDAGASAEPAGRILDVLRDYDVHVTFFLTGRWAEENPDLVRRMAAEGHEFGNHTYSHPQLTQVDDATLRQELDRTEQIIRDLAGQSSRPLLRPPYGDRDRRVWDLLAEEGYISIFWTVDSWDSVGETKTPEFLLERVTQPKDSQGNPIPLEGAIILMHIGSAPSAEALPNILAWFQANEWDVVRLSEILRLP